MPADNAPPWPDDPPCPVCGEPVSTSRHDPDQGQNVFAHVDSARAPCAMSTPQGTPVPKGYTGAITFAVRTAGPSFDTLEDAEVWATQQLQTLLRLRELGAKADFTPYRLGHVKGEGGHRQIGPVESLEHALSVVEVQDGEVVTRRR
jgi:hypothetical protein